MAHSGRLALILGAATLLVSGAALAQKDVSLDITMKPVRGDDAQVQYIDFRTEIRGAIDQSSGPFTLYLPITYTSLHGIADRVDNLVLHDANGDVALKVVNDPEVPADYGTFRHWQAERRVSPPLVATYRLRPKAGHSGPQYEVFAVDGGIGGAGMELFILPEKAATIDAHVKWDLSGLAPGAVGTSTHGENEFRIHGDQEKLLNAFYMAGPLGSYTGSSGFRAYWEGKPKFDPLKEAKWANKAYEYLRGFYRDTTSPSFRLLVRTGSGGGTQAQNSAMVGVPAGDEDPSVDGPYITFAHEMGHSFLGNVKLQMPRDYVASGWWLDGINVHYTRLLMMRAGLIAPSVYLDDINSTSARGYYGSVYRNASNQQLREIGYGPGPQGGGVQRLPYARGSLFWADMDWQIREKSHGARKLDDVIVPLLVQRQKTHVDLTETSVADALARELGPTGRDQFKRKILEGADIVPASGAYGPCFERKPEKYKTSQGTELDGYKWERIESVPDDRCRAW